MHVVDVGERPRQLMIDELEGAAHRLDADLDEDAWRVLDVVARGLNQPRRLAQLRHDAACSLFGGGIGEQGLSGETSREDVAVALRVLFPGADRLDLEHATADVRGQHPLFETLDRGEPLRRDFIEAAQVSSQRMRLSFHRVAAEVLEQVVVRMHAIEGGVGRMGFAQIAEQVVDEMGERFGCNH
jgi:hypothetical protein